MNKHEFIEWIQSIWKLTEMGSSEDSLLMDIFQRALKLQEPKEMTVEEAWLIIGDYYGDELLQNNIEYVEMHGYTVTLKEPHKPLVPHMIAEYIEDMKARNNTLGEIAEVVYGGDIAWSNTTDIMKWVRLNFSTFAKAFENGYEIDKKRKYYLRNIY